MKMFMHLLLATLMVLVAVSCKKDAKPDNGDPGNGDEPGYVVPEAIDLGIELPRLDEDGNPLKDGNENVITYKLYWASFNLGASKPEEYGDYFAWGEITPYYSCLDPLTWRDGKTGYDWASYKWCNGSVNSLTKYNAEDNKTVLDLDDDAARKNLGGKWRMPTSVEWKALIDNCHRSTETIGDVDGLLITGPNDNSIFLPFAGCWLNTTSERLGDNGNYWLSSLSEFKESAEYGDCTRLWGTLSIEINERENGFPIRPVCEE